MKENTRKFVRSARNNAGKALMVLSLVGMMGMNVSAANGRELTDINKDVNVSKYNLSLNANGRIEYDKNLDGKKEVFYDYLDYQKLAQSLETINNNETELNKEYTRLYNLAEQNRKELIKSWNRFGVLTLGDDALYVTGEGTKSIKGAMDSMPVHSFNEIGLSFADGAVHVSYPNPAWGVYNGGQIDTAAINQQIAEAMTHTEWLYMNKDNSPSRQYDMTANHKIRYVDASGIWQWGYEEGWNARTPSIKSSIATANWMNEQSVNVSLKKDTTYHVYCVNSGINSSATNIRLKKKGAKSWNIFNVEKTKGSDGTGGAATFTDLPSGNNLNDNIKSLSYASNTRAFVDIKIVPKKDIDVTLAVSAYDGYGIAFIEQ